MTFPEFHVWWVARSRLRPLALALAAVAAAGSGGLAGIAPPLSLVMVEEYGCRFCLRWNSEVGTVYDRSAEGRKAPLVRVGRDAAQLKGLKPVVYTPTFILMRGGAEIGRITGYPGKIFFWEELAALIEDAVPAQSGHSNAARD